MGPHQSKTIKKQLLEPILPSAKQDGLVKDDLSVISKPSLSSGAPPRASINTVQAKVWNPNNPESWDVEMREYHSLEDSQYALPSDEIEQSRLEVQHFVFRVGFKGDVICPAAKELVKQPGIKVLDVGCAKGFWLESVRKENPLAEYYGVDIAQTLVSESQGIKIQFGNVLEGLPCMRFLVLGMPKDRYADALKELVRVAKPGGWIEIVEADVVVYKSGPHSKAWGQAMFSAMAARGLDCYAATNLEWHARNVSQHISHQDTRTLHFRSRDDNTALGKMTGENNKTGILALEDWMHKAMGITREEYRELADSCFEEWAEYKSFGQARALYFQVKK
ncbi:hypothetical protein HK100_005293 [Physocladia obscura]|uniref:Methyltransferase domain-containing protein n=1 Tax=Physocladia obscura TaxID=109957 RepID=A0AAD5SXH8_9FUNG|nr:hypothetical protein HK100_005293 [Physocladia obscura]